MNESDYNKTKCLMIRELCDDNINIIIVLEMNDV